MMVETCKLEECYLDIRLKRANLTTPGLLSMQYGTGCGRTSFFIILYDIQVLESSVVCV